MRRSCVRPPSWPSGAGGNHEQTRDAPVTLPDLDPAELTVLVVDDERENLDAFTRALRGYQLLSTDRGEQALVLLAERRIDIVVADQRMPGTRGAQLLQRARAINPLTRRIIVSASSAPEHILEAINSGEVERYLLKPLGPTAL